MTTHQRAGRWAVACVLMVVAVAGGGEDRPALKDADPLPVGSTWTGKLTQQGTHPQASFPPEVDAALTVTRRQGDNVELELRETMPGLDITFVCNGQMVRRADGSLSLEFKSHGVKGMPMAGFFLIGVPYRAKIVGNSIQGTWNYVEEQQSVNMNGEFTLLRQ